MKHPIPSSMKVRISSNRRSRLIMTSNCLLLLSFLLSIPCHAFTLSTRRLPRGQPSSLSMSLSSTTSRSPVVKQAISLLNTASSQTRSLLRSSTAAAAAATTTTRLSMSDVTVDDSNDEPGQKKTSQGFLAKVTSFLPPANERQKLVPLALMFFCILFNYTILRDTKDVLMVTAPKSGAEGKERPQKYWNTVLSASENHPSCRVLFWDSAPRPI